VYRCDCAGQTYFVVTVVDQDNLESADSNEASAKIRCLSKLLRLLGAESIANAAGLSSARLRNKQSSDDANLLVIQRPAIF
jgi:hypothetical protein